MKIYKKGDKIIVELDYWQEMYNPYSDGVVGKMHNCVGVIAGDELTISQLIDMDYKGKPPQEGPPIIHYFGSEKDFIKLCKELGISIIKHSVCSECHKAIYGCSSFNAEGKEICMKCEKYD